MSRIGNRVLTIPANLSVEVTKEKVIVKNAKQSLEVNYDSKILEIETKDNQLTVKANKNIQKANMFQGTVNALIRNTFIGLTDGFKIELELKGVGYRAKLEGNKINLNLGFSHPVIIDIPALVEVTVPSATEIVIKGADKQVVGQLAVEIRKYRKPEPYKGKGVLYKGEHVVRKVGKTADKKK